MLAAFSVIDGLTRQLILSHSNLRPLKWTESKSYHGRQIDIRKYCIVVQRINIKLFNDETSNIHP